MNKILVALILSASLCAYSQTTYRSYLKDPVRYREHVLDITRMKVEVSFVPEQNLVKGIVTHSFSVLQQKVDSVFFDGPSIKITSATLDGKKLNYKTVATGIWVFPDEPMTWDQKRTIRFEYEANPRKGIYFIGWNTEKNPEKSPWAIRKQIWTQGQGIDNRHWIPMYDNMNDKYITETVITFDKRYQVLSNGNLIKKSHNKDNTITWNYAMSKPHAGYLLMIAIGDYAIQQSKSKSNVPMSFWYYPEFSERMKPTYRYSEQMVDFIEKETGMPFPWESYSQIMVQDFLYGAMENTTATLFGDFFNVDERAYLDRNYVNVNCHELTHQWFGDYVTARDGRDIWLQESFATYYPKKFAKEIYGDDEYAWMRRQEHNNALEASKKDLNPIRNSAGGRARFYPKGSSVIEMLAYVLGEEQWKRALKGYLIKHAYANVETNDLVKAIQDQLGMDMTWFFDQWVYRGGEPAYTVSYEQLELKEGTFTQVQVQQTHARNEVTGLFKMPIEIEVHYKDGSVDKVRQWIEKEYETVRVKNAGKKPIAFVLFDPQSKVLKSVVFKKSIDELFAQLRMAPNFLDRYDALVALRETEIKQKRATLTEAFYKEKFHILLAEIASQLANDPNAESIKIMHSVFGQSDPKPKLAVIKALKNPSDEIKMLLEKSIKDSSYDVVMQSLEKLSKFYPAETHRYLEQTKDVDGMGNIVAVKWHEISVESNYMREESLNKLVFFAGNAWEFKTRTNAFNALKTLNYCNEKLIANLFDAILSTNGKLSVSAAQLIESLAFQIAYRNMMRDYYSKMNWQDWQKETLTEKLSFLT